MKSIITEMLSRYQAEGLTDKKNALKEVMQEIVLCGLSRAGFFKKTAFCRGTALRIIYGLDRFSEDLDFSLLAPDPDFDLTSYFPTLKKEVTSYGLDVEISEKETDLIQKLNGFKAAVRQAGQDYSPSGIANYCYELTKEYNQFYHDFSILGEEDENKKIFRLALSKAVAKVVRLGMGLLGIEMPERM
jgi:hypothetical protein